MELAEDLGGTRRVDQVLGQKAVERRQGDRAVGEDFDVETAGTEGDDRSEDRVAEDADHQFAAVRARQEGLDRDAVDLGVGPALLHGVDDVVVGVAHGRRVADVEAHAAGIGFVRQVGRIDLHGDREADLFGQQQRFGGGTGDHGLRHRHLEGAQDGLRFHLG
ncbi:hypothetical protein SDC9_172794 [bioreactor metagenome]|uniref:Uncharacterized protein n=1 Tax=bioreactor metagenome TaxID=1076179 RepID=A0A645GFC0_9ZZZZ